MADRAQLAHLLRRATFGPRADDVDTAERVGLDATLASLLTPSTADAAAAGTPMPQFGGDPVPGLARTADRAARQQAQQQLRTQEQAAVLWWLDRMVAAYHQFAEKLVFFWHGHWATSVQKVRSAALMLRQQQTFRDHGSGDFGALLSAMLRDPALVIWLDGQQNTRAAPNENLARECMELFTLGIGNYTETDVREAARALTGAQVNRAAMTVTVNPRRHDSGSKTILGQTGGFDLDGFAGILLAQPANATFLAGRLWYRFGSGQPMPADTRDRLVAAYQPKRDVTALARAVFTDPAFAGTAGALVKQPVEWVVGAMRQLGIRPSALPTDAGRQLMQGLTALGQTPFEPPSVGGWPAGPAWLTTSATQTRVRLGALLSAHAAPSVLDALRSVPAAQRPDALARVLVVDAFTDRTRAVLAAAAGDPQRVIALGLASPEYAVS
jgi:uncharacterized protein (DUF1800 family)